jgi:Protein of unknown function (DUF2628)
MIGVKVYSIYANPGEPESAIAVKDGFSWFAFFLAPLWALYHRMWVAAILLFLINAAFMGLADAKIANPEIWSVMHMIVMLICGFEGNGWLEKNLVKRGFELKDIIMSPDAFRAKYKFLRREMKVCHG